MALATRRVMVRVEWVGEAEEVQVEGDFTCWAPVPLSRPWYPSPLWVLDIPVPPGCYSYRYYLI